MDAVGVDGALLISPFTMYRYDASYAIEVRNRYPDRFALIKPVDPKWYMSQDEVAKMQAANARGSATSEFSGIGKGGFDAQAAVFWAFVGIPLAWGVWKTLESAIKIL